MQRVSELKTSSKYAWQILRILSAPTRITPSGPSRRVRWTRGRALAILIEWYVTFFLAPSICLFPGRLHRINQKRNFNSQFPLLFLFYSFPATEFLVEMTSWMIGGRMEKKEGGKISWRIREEPSGRKGRRETKRGFVVAQQCAILCFVIYLDSTGHFF